VELGYRMFDADNHLYETADAFTRHLPERRRRDFYWVTDDRGHRLIVVGNRVWDYIPNPTFDPVAVAGALDRRKVEPLADRPEYRDPVERLARFDEQAIEASLMFPTLASGLCEIVGGNLPLLSDLTWSFNRWLDDDWGFAFRNRIFATPLFTLSDVDQSVETLEWAIDRGCRAIMVFGGPVRTPSGWTSPADTMFDPVWARCAEAGVVVCVHAAASGYNRHSGEYTGNYELRPFQDQTLDNILNHGRPVSDYFAAMIWQGATARHPKLRLLSVENRSDWVPRLVSLLARFGRRASSDEHPVDAFHRCVWVTPHWEDNIAGLAEVIPVERVTAGSDYPHYDALADPTDFAKHLDGFDAEDVRKVMRENLRGLLDQRAEN
jgi:predicted TIM-barrel fold metal-dependent hydrolase